MPACLYYSADEGATLHPATIQFRWSSTETQLISRGLDIVRYHARDLRLAAYDPDLLLRIAHVVCVVKEIIRRPQASKHRMHLDAISIAICMFAVRSIACESKLGQIRSQLWPAAVDKEDLLKRLEKFRKRGKRKWLRIGDSAEYQNISRRWRRFLGWVRANRRPLKFRRHPNCYRRHLNWAITNVKRVLAAEMQGPLPPDDQLRPLVRKMMRHVRRERGFCTVKDLICGSELGDQFISFYMPRLIAKYEVESNSPPLPDAFSPTRQRA